ncbi:MAG: DUF4202 family protein [Acidobacteria bacterium]|nr:DUF4202 family protein [Acidobacteriota bacterium]MBV9478129.1 DUF4202 family protein [Acidobacteriota bacterium]
MLEEVTVVAPHEPNRGVLLAQLAAEFPSIFARLDGDAAEAPHVRASEWRRADFDTWSFDCRVDELASAPFTLTLAHDADDAPRFPIEVLNRCQRAIGRRNRHSQGQLFTRVLERHRALHDVAKPLVRADYNHARDAWQWLLRLDAEASLAVQIAALFHDIERLASESDARVEHHADDYQTFKDAHARAGAAMTDAVLAEAGVNASIGARVCELVARHERPSDDAELALLNDADALSFLSLNSPGYADYFGAEQTRKKLAYTWNRMRPSARAKLGLVHLRDDVGAWLREVTEREVRDGSVGA